MNSSSQTHALRIAVQRFVRCMGLLQVRQTPCGQPLSVPQAHALMFLANRSTTALPPTQQVLADHLRLNKSTVTRLLEQLSRRRLVGIEPSQSDKRAKWIHLTYEGQKMASTVERASLELFEQILCALPVDDRHGVVQAIEQLTQAIQQRQTGAPQ